MNERRYRMSIVQVAYANGVLERLKTIAKDNYLELYTEYSRDRDLIKGVFYDPISAKCLKIEIDLVRFNDKEEDYAAIKKELYDQNLAGPTPENPKPIFIQNIHFDTEICKRLLNGLYGKASASNLYIKEIDEMHETPNIWFKTSTFTRPISSYDAMEIEKVIFNDPATIVVWADGTKTVVKAENEPYDEEKGLAMAIAKKALGNQGNYYEVFKKWLRDI